MNVFLNGQVENDGFLRVAAASPRIRVADVEGNAEVALAAVREAAGRGVRALVLPELNLTGYTAADLLHNRTLLHACEAALVRILDATRELPIVFTVGLPVAVAENIYNCAAVCCAGELLGLTAKKYLPEEKRREQETLNVRLKQKGELIASHRQELGNTRVREREASDE